MTAAPTTAIAAAERRVGGKYQGNGKSMGQAGRRVEANTGGGRQVVLR